MQSRVITLALAFSFAATACGQDWPPQLTEVWDPEPAVVTPGDASAPPQDAVILFDGTSLAAWQSARDGSPAGWSVADGAMTVVAGTGDIRTREMFGDVQLHIEFRTPAEVRGEGQGRGNSGVYLQGLYEVQILDSYGNRTYSNGQAASVYKQHMPLVNASRPPGVWQTYDIFFRAPVFDLDLKIVRKASVTVVHNGVLVQFDAEIQGATTYVGLPRYEAHGDGPILLQDHGNPMSFRNIWIRRL